jgi:5,10-methylenetetrahydrofolate reductase
LPFPHALRDLALEITSPRLPQIGVLLRRAAALSHLTRRINVIHRPDRWSSLEASGVLVAHGYEPVWHLPNRGRSIETIQSEIRRARALGVRRVLCVRGEYKTEDETDTPRIREVVRLLRRGHPAARVAVTLNPHGRIERALANLWPKLEAGACSVQLQVTLDVRTVDRAAEAVKTRHAGARILPMLLPVLSADAARRVSRRLDIPLPTRLLGSLETEGEPAGWAWLRDQVELLAASPLYDGLALMTPIDPPPELRAGLVALLGAIRRANPV